MQNCLIELSILAVNLWELNLSVPAVRLKDILSFY